MVFNIINKKRLKIYEFEIICGIVKNVRKKSKNFKGHRASKI